MNRRELIKNALYAATALTLNLPIAEYAVGAPQPAGASKGSRTLRIVRRTIDVKGRAASVFGLAQPDGMQGLTFQAGEPFDVTLHNETADATLIHWHGLTPPWEQDGVPGAPSPLLLPNANRQYRFPVGAAGTHWMHAHTLQEQSLLAAPLIVYDPNEQQRDIQDVVILLHDFSFKPPEELLAGLKNANASAHANSTPMDHAAMGHGAPAPMTNMTGADLNDIEYDAYLANDRTLDDPQVVPLEKRARVRLRIINGATATAFTIDLGALEGTLLAVDGQDVAPIKGRRFPISMGQRLDIGLDLASANEAIPILALREGARERTGIILAQPGARITKLAAEANDAGPVVDLSLEETLRAARPLVPRQADKRIELKLDGDMQSYVWGLSASADLSVRRNERIELVMTNTSMMAHPMHLHGHHFQVVAIDGRRLSGAVRDTVHVPPNRSVTVAFDGNNPGEWALHCHHLYHMAAGMMTFLKYAA